MHQPRTTTKTAYEIMPSLVGSEMCIRDRDLTEARDSEWQWHQLGDMQVCTSLQTYNHANTPPLSCLQAGCPSCRPTDSVKALKATSSARHQQSEL